MRAPGIYIGSVGSYLPDVVPTGSDDEVSITGATVAGDMPPVEMALRAARLALARWTGTIDLIKLLLYVDIYPSGPEGWSPVGYLQREMLHGDMLGAGVRSGCNGVFHALELAAGQLRVMPDDAAALVTAADNVGSPLIDRWNVLEGFAMSDNATALVLSRRPGFARLRSVHTRSLPELEQLHRGDEPLHPAGVVLGRKLDFTARARQFAKHFDFTESTALLMFKTLNEVVQQALAESDITLADVTRVSLTTEPQPKPDERLKALGISPEISTWQYGRTIGHSPNDQVLALNHLLDQGELRPGDHFLMIGIGPGINFAAAVIEIVDEIPWRTATAAPGSVRP
jgi:3-oxoacyl-[acyl-carrier-protein] synthase-3/clorobiocin biosynthesis protein CloN2